MKNLETSAHSSLRITVNVFVRSRRDPRSGPQAEEIEKPDDIRLLLFRGKLLAYIVRSRNQLTGLTGCDLEEIRVAGR